MNCLYYAFLTESEISTELTIICKKEKHFVYRRTHGYRETQKTSTCKTRLCVTPYKLHLNREGKKNQSHGKYELLYSLLC